MMHYINRLFTYINKSQMGWW